MKFKHTDTSYYMHICGLQEFLYTIKVKKYARTVIKKSSPKPFKMLKSILLRGGGGLCPLNPPTRALPWTHRGLGGPLDPSPKLVPPPPPKGQCLDPALLSLGITENSRNIDDFLKLLKHGGISFPDKL